MPRFLLYVFLLLFLPFIRVHSQEQDKTKILLTGDKWEFNKDIFPDGPRVLGNVVMNHDSAYLYCDSAYMNEAANKMIAYGNVHILLSDTLNLYSDSLRYDGTTRIAVAYSNVRLVDNQTILTTDTLIYNRLTQIAQYNYWGKIVNDKNILVSKHGYYYTAKKEFFFKEKVNLIHPDYKMFSDTLMYNTVTEISYFFGPSHIISNDKLDSIWCENGWYDTRQDFARFRERAKIYHEATFLTGDSMYYERTNGFGQVFRHAVIIDTVQNIVLTGHYGELQRKKEFAFMTDSAMVALVEKKDSLFLHSDTVWAKFDSTKKIRSVYCFHKVKFFRHDLQGLCDSLVYSGHDSTVTMYYEPVLWSDSNQLTADSIRLTLINGQADSLKMYGSSFIISKDDTGSYNQIKGRNVIAKFMNGDLYKINVLGNAQTIYYAREEDRSLIGINIAIASDMLIYLENRQIKTITYINRPEAHLYPEKDVNEQDKKLKGFRWEEKRRPKSKEDLFTSGSRVIE